MTTVASTTSLQNLVRLVAPVNPNQAASLQKLMPHSEADRLYLEQFIPATSTFVVLGTVNDRTNVREKYNVKMCQVAGKRTFECSCKDFLLRSTQHNKVCKHVCFIVCKFGGIFDAGYFNSADKILPPTHFATLTDKAQRFVNGAAVEAMADAAATDDRECFQTTATAIVRTTIPRPASIPLRFAPTSWRPGGGAALMTPPTIMPNFCVFSKPIDDACTCPICFDAVEANPATTAACPQCHNYVHRECVAIWLQRNRTCIMCRDTSWQWFK